MNDTGGIIARRLEALERRTDRLQAHLGQLPVRPFVAPFSPTDPTPTDLWRGLWGRIDGATRVGSNWRWIYAITEMEPATDSTGYLSTGWQVKTDGFVGNAYNFMELDNSDDGTLGVGITVTELEDPDCPFVLLPLPTGWIFPFQRVPRPTAGGSNVIEYWTTITNGMKPES